jgi:hypothetical protein
MGSFFEKERITQNVLIQQLRVTTIESCRPPCYHQRLSCIELVAPTQCLLYEHLLFVGFAYQEGKDIVFTFIIEYSSLRDFGPWVISLFLYKDF